MKDCIFQMTSHLNHETHRGSGVHFCGHAHWVRSTSCGMIQGVQTVSARDHTINPTIMKMTIGNIILRFMTVIYCQTMKTILLTYQGTIIEELLKTTPHPDDKNGGKIN